jgi:aminoglycoside 6'-N-acetyltransferase I
MKFSKINLEDFPAWKQMRIELYSALDDDYHNEEMEITNSSDQWYCRLIKNDADEVMGMLEISYRNIVDGCISSPVPYIEGIYLYPHYRNKGYGTEILKKIVTWCKEQGYTELATDAQIINSAAHRFYKSAGFEETDRVVEFRMALSGNKQHS